MDHNERIGKGQEEEEEEEEEEDKVVALVVVELLWHLILFAHDGIISI